MESKEQKYKVVKITWTDASGIDQWTKVKDLPDTSVPCYSVGFLIKTTRQYYFLANTHTRDDEEDELMTSGVIMIPKKWAVKMEVLEE